MLACGNGAINFGETCDDGNTMAGDGCSAMCQLEAIDVTASGTGTPLTIPDPGSAMSTATIASACTIDEAIITVNMNHAFAGDVVLTLTSPEGTAVVLTDAVGGGTDLIGTYVFRVAGTAWAPSGSAVASGTYARPDLAMYVDEAGMGTWTLVAEDIDAIIAGSVTSWSVSLVCE